MGVLATPVHDSNATPYIFQGVTKYKLTDANNFCYTELIAGTGRN